MFLKQMKIVGFKSFVEPTVLYFNSNRVAVVGPNGCGKSNVIDAIRWVMGESSPKFLRGDLMSDVIFNGSLQRKPVGVASVEIILDNQTDYLKGAYIAKGEVSLKREINRSGDSTYFINGHKVRRRDLTDLWLGTGAGARGYAIIGQNMINHLVEANPEVLRGYLEEAAGVSKYKERRKESAERLTQVADNLARIDDIIFELSGQVQRLEKEASDAQQYQSLKKDLRAFQLQLDIAKARKLYERNAELQENLTQQEQSELSLQSTLEQLQSKISTQEEQISNFQADLHRQEQHLYQKSLQVKHQQQLYQQRLLEHQRFKEEQQHLNQEFQEIHLQLEAEQKQLAEINIQGPDFKAQLDQLDTQTQERRTNLQQIKNQLREAQQKRHQLRAQIQQQKTQSQVLNAKLEQGTSNLEHVKLQMQKWLQLSNKQDLSLLQQKIQDSQQSLLPIELQLNQLKQEIDGLQTELQFTQTRYHELKYHKQQLQSQLEQTNKNLMMSEAAYKGLINHFDSAQSLTSNIGDWLEQWKIPGQWRLVIDWLWNQFLPGVLSDMPDPIPNKGFFATLKPIQQQSSLPLSRLLALMGVENYPSGFILWREIYVADDVSSALSYKDKLDEMQSIITPQGVWIGRDWLKVIASQESQSDGLASRLNQFKQAQAEHDLMVLKFKDFEQLFLQQEQSFFAQKNNLEDKNNHYHKLELSLNLSRQQHQGLEQQLFLLKQEQIRHQQELQSCETQYAQTVAQNREWQLQIEQIQQDLQTQEAEEKRSGEIIDTHQADVDQIEQQIQLFTRQFEQQKFEAMRLQTQHDFLSKSLPKLQQRADQIKSRQQQIYLSLTNSEQEEQLNPRFFTQLEAELKQEQLILDDKHVSIKEMLEDKKGVTKLFEQTKAEHLKVLEKKWRTQTEKEQNIHELEEQKKHFLEDFSPQMWQNLEKHHDAEYFRSLILTLEQKLQLLGDVNLLAIGLFEQETQRYKDMLEQQEDLKQAMKQLDIAIATLDQAMQTELSHTLQAINVQLLTIFPQLFGGGEAKFVASCDNLLEASVSVQVQLPGKKQHRIQLLSGGEKALTAIALLFAIFSLNPAPFCLLDEVDAALDDANVIRLANLIKEMSNTVQFILITHNPLTMDVADELVGVTMQEPGVSRVVSVNMAMALALAMVNKE
jgi:chromosome segregation protein